MFCPENENLDTNDSKQVSYNFGYTYFSPNIVFRGIIDYTKSEKKSWLVELTADVVTTLNTYSYCGDSDWALNTVKDYSGKSCDGVTYPAKNTTISGVYKLDGSSLLINTDNITSVGSTVFTKQ